MTRITPVILCGGSGTRLWPLSRKSYPKQFVRLVGEETLFQASVRRLAGAKGVLDFAAPLVVTNSEFRFVVAEQMLETGIDPGPILIEPVGRNTAPAILAAALKAQQDDPKAMLLVSPSDHVIPDTDAFHAAVARGSDAAAEGRIVTFGIVPDRAETGYGYLALATPVAECGGNAVALTKFVEKPIARDAARMVADGRHLWNAGIFLFSARTIVEAFRVHAPDLLDVVSEALAAAKVDLGFIRLDKAAWARARDVSIDYAVMEKFEAISVVPFNGGWSDLGSWEAVLRESPRDENGVATSGPTTAIDCHDVLLRSESDDLELVGLGLTDIIAVAMPDAVLVAHMSRAQDVKHAVDALKARKARQATEFRRDYRPWGYYETLALADRFQVKRIVVKTGAALSLQSHHHRSEHWIVVAGTARVTVDKTVKLVTENESVYIPLGAVHRMENPGKVPLVLIEVQTGAYLGEDDIIRYEDVYARGEGAKG